MEYPSNSREQRPEPQSETPTVVTEPVKKVVTGKVIKRKKPLGQKFMDFFGGSDGSGVVDYVINEVLVPALRDMVVDAGTTAIERTFSREGSRPSPRRPSTRRGDHRDRISYDRIQTDRIRSRTREENRRPMSRRGRRSHDFNEIVFESSREAYDVLEELRRKVHGAGNASVADLYISAGLESEYTDDEWGWYDLETARVARCDGGFRLVLSPTESLDEI